MQRARFAKQASKSIAGDAAFDDAGLTDIVTAIEYDRTVGEDDDVVYGTATLARAALEDHQSVGRELIRLGLPGQGGQRKKEQDRGGRHSVPRTTFVATSLSFPLVGSRSLKSRQVGDLSYFLTAIQARNNPSGCTSSQ